MQRRLFVVTISFLMAISVNDTGIAQSLPDPAIGRMSSESRSRIERSKIIRDERGERPGRLSQTADPLAAAALLEAAKEAGALRSRVREEAREERDQKPEL